eukprot:TRINITY_DN1774_c0_g1_i8.p1 TRINITY_DN1774_c0_g1~~TRINITY_DN1774_c0_g1_i8.p1  ORF type:complete len:143 (+),score=35.82 TRINITY_DN1774_c0_g1_i8:51-479(+)
MTPPSLTRSRLCSVNIALDLSIQAPTSDSLLSLLSVRFSLLSVRFSLLSVRFLPLSCLLCVPSSLFLPLLFENVAVPATIDDPAIIDEIIQEPIDIFLFSLLCSLFSVLSSLFSLLCSLFSVLSSLFLPVHIQFLLFSSQYQ